MLEIGKIILTDDMLTGKGSEKFAEDHEHSWRSSPAGDHAIGNPGEAVSGFAAHFVETVLIFDDICEGETSGRSRVALQSPDSFNLGCYVTLVT